MFTSMMRKALLADDAKLSLDFTSGVLPSGVTFSRAANTATFVNSGGLVQNANADQPRFDLSSTGVGLLIEPSATNLAINSSAMWNWGTSGPTKTQDTATADIRGETGAANITTKVVKAAGAANQYTTLSLAIPQISVPASSSVDVTLSVWIRMDGANQPKCSLGILETSGTPSFGAVFGTKSPNGQSVSNNSVTTSSYTSAECEYTFGNVTGWVRCSISRRLTNTTGSTINWTTGLALIYPDRFTTNAATIYVAGAQIETGIGPTSWIPTLGSTATRNPDICTISGAAFSSWYNASEGTFFAHFRRRRTDNTASVLSANNNSTAEVIELAADTAAKFNIVDNGSSQVASFVTPFLANTDTKLAGAFKIDDSQMASNGASSSVDSTATIPTVDRLYIGRDAGAVPVYLDGHVRSVKFYDYRKDQTKLGEMTT